MEDGDHKPHKATDTRVEDLTDWVVCKIASAFNIRTRASQDTFKTKLLAKEENKQAVDAFIVVNQPAEVIYALQTSGGDSAELFFEFPQNIDKWKKKGLVLFNISTQGLTNERDYFHRNVVVLELTRNILEHLYGVFNEIMSPVMQNAENQIGWTDLVTKDLMEKFNGYVAQVYVMMGLIKGRTMLPLPSHKLTSSDTTPDKDKAHVFEGSIITWTKQIKNVLKQEPEQVLKYGNDPGPLTELEFWQNKADNLNSIHEQLQSVEVKNILRFLEGNKSTYTNPFSKLKKDVQKARIEANDNNLFLKTLKEPFQHLVDSGTDFTTLHELFIPIMHTILLIWKNSKYYNTPPRLVVLIREICNAIIQKAQAYVDGPTIFGLISNKETSEACEKLQYTIDVCSKFKDAYFEYKAKAEGGWKLTTNALFVRLDSFLERAHDILHLTNTIVQFNKLEKIELGGTKGKTLTESILQIFQEFDRAVVEFTEVKYDIMDISQKDFDDDFYKFRSKIKELERRLASVITQGFDDYDTIYGRFKLLDNFEGLLNRPIIQDELEKKHIVLLEMYKQDLKQVQSIFLEGKVLVDKNHENTPIFLNMPPISGALTWCKSLRDRIQEPIDKLASLGQGITEREEYKDVKKLYESITSSIKHYQDQKILQWSQEVEESSEDKLKQSLLTKDENGVVKVNFDPSLVRLLREVKYFLLLQLVVPQTAADIYQKGETYRKQIVCLDMIVNNYNQIITCLHPVEEPLVKKRIQDMEQEMNPGIEEHKWKSPYIDQFIGKSKNIVDGLFETVQKMKESLKKVEVNLSTFNTKIIERKNKPMSPEDYDQFLKAHFANKIGIVKDCGTSIQKTVKEVLDAVKADKKGVAWKNYNDYVNCILIDGIAEAIQTALKHLNDQIDPEYLRKNEIGPMFDIKLELTVGGVQFEPPIDENENIATTVRNVIKSWISDFFTIAGTISRLDSSSPGDYLQEIRAYFEVKQCLAQINTNLDETENNCMEFKSQFDKYSLYWEKDPISEFARFLDENEVDDYKGDEEEEGSNLQKENPLLQGCRAKIPPLDMFDDNITLLKQVQSEIEKIPREAIRNWLRIDIKPMKESLNAKVQQWIRIYTDFLVKQFRTTLKNLQNFITKTLEGISKNPADEENMGDNELLMKVMRVISDVKDVEPRESGIVVRLKDMVVKLKKHNVIVQEKGAEDPLQAIDNANTEFKEMVAKVFNVKSEIIPLQAKETVEIKKRLEKFSTKVQNYRQEFLNTLPFDYEDRQTIDEINSNFKVIDNFFNKTCTIENEAYEYNKLERLFELQRSNYKQLKECLNDLKNLKTMWDSISMISYQYNDWKSKPWRQIKAETMLEINKALQLELKKLPKEIRMFKGYNVEVDKVKNMGTVLPLVSALHSEFMEDRHWDQLKTLTGKQFDHKSMSFTFEDILSLNLYKYENHVNEIVDVAQKEAKIEAKLKKIEQDWNKQYFEFEEYKETKIFKPLDMMLELLDANAMDLMGMKSQGKYVEYFLVIVEHWREKLTRVDTVVQQWLKVQKDWRMLVNIFLASEDIRMQLPEDTKRFEDVDKEFRELMNDVSVNPLVVEACTPERKELLDTWAQKIKQCEKSLNDYLEQKKKAFPRFYYLSNQNLLTILSNGQNAPKVCTFLGDCFDGLSTLKFLPAKAGEQFPRIGEGLISKDKEYIPFQGNFTCEGAVENWLLALEHKMRETLELILETAKQTSELWDQGDKPREEWVEGYNAQVALLTTQIVWTEDVTRAFEDLQGGSETAMKECHKQIESRITCLINKVRGDLPRLERMKIINIITIDVHGRDVVEKFVMQKIQEAESFAWLSQLKFFYENKPDSDMHTRQNLRFSWEKSKDRRKCIIKIVDWFRFYSYEYVGNAMRLVVTPLTDRCYITLTQALNLVMGGAPAGPAGTGKTETTKDLGRGVGILVVVFNCSDQMNKDSMAQIFMGLAQSGSWGCFDEFNRISIEVLSVISTQIKLILDALKEKKQKFNFVEEAGEINLVDTVGFFITMNPGYAGRTELPENLKALFRSCAMVVPDLVLICENMLMSEGFTQARTLSRKFVSLYMLCRDLLSKAKHYDWALRAIKSVLRQAGGLKRQDPDMPEDPLLMRALRDFNIPKIVTDDKQIFMRLIGDLFPKAEALSKEDPDLFKLVKETAKKNMGLVNEYSFILKIVQLKEILEVRHCCFIIGPPGCGKTEVWKTLARSLTNKGEDCEYDTLNPKAVSADELFGAYSKTKEWKNGVLAVIMKNQKGNEDKYKETNKHKWSVLDGDIDPEWIESLNTVMDDNKVLTLVSNERIALTPEMRLLFEISNLRNATPATVSRAGVLFINESDIGWMPYMQQWSERSVEKVKKASKDGGNIVESIEIDEVGKFIFFKCFQQYIEGNSDVHDKDRVRYITPMCDMGMVQSICAILDQMLVIYQDKLKQIKDRSEDDLRLCYEAMFIFAGIWGIGGGVGGGQDDEKDMKDFSSVWKSAAKVKFPEQGNVYDYFWDMDQMKWELWNTKVKAYVIQDDGSNAMNIFSKIYVNTVHTTRLKYLLDIHLARRKAILFVGGAGTGKTSVIKQYLATSNPDKVSHRTIAFSSFTDSQSLQRNIESMVEKKSGRTFGSATNKVLICFLDDLNMPYVDKYYTQQPIQLLRQIIDYGQVYNREQLEEKKYLQDLLFFSCMNQKSGSFFVDLRLQRNFTAMTMNTPQQDIIETIFVQILNSHLASVSDKLQKQAEPVVRSTVAVFQRILKDTRYSPSARKFHYQFNFRELSKIVEGLCKSTQREYRDNPYQLYRLWAHEMKRTYEDRFISREDIDIFRKYLQEGYAKFFGEPPEDKNPIAEPLIFTHFISEHLGQDPVYVEHDIVVLKKTLDEKMEEYNEVKAQMNLVLFQQAMEHVVRICRMLSMGGNNALLVGVGGSGKQSLTRLASFISGFEIDQMIVTASFGITDMRNYLQEIYKKIAKPSSSPRVFMITDAQIKEEIFLIPINDMLNSGWIPDLFTKEDLDGMISNVRNEAKGFGVVDTLDCITNFFMDKIRKNLKVVLCFSPVGDLMRVRSRKFPGIINSTSIDWFHPWPRDALIDVAGRFIADVDFPTDELRNVVAVNMATVHTSIDDANARFLRLERRNNYTTPKSFLELIDFYKKILQLKRDNIETQIVKYQKGLDIIADTQGKVQGLQEDLKIKMISVNQKKGETDELIDKVGQESAAAEIEQNIANEEEEKTNKAAAEATAMKDEADAALSEALPALRRAEQAIDQVNKGHITEMKNLGSPPLGVVVTGRVMLILMGERVTLNDPDDKVWKKSQQSMNNPAQFLDKIKSFNGDNIDDSILDPVNKIIKDPSKKFTEKDMLSQNFAASKLASWVVNIVEYNRIFKLVKPLQEKVARSTEELETKKRELAVVKERVRVLTEKVNNLKRNLEEAETQKQIVEKAAQQCLDKLSAAEKLVNGLAGENKRWGQNVKDLGENILSVIGDALLASAFVSYIGAFSAKLRLDLWKNTWLPDIIDKKIPITDDITPLKVLTTEAIMAKWKNENLPADPMSLENATVITSCSRWPLMIDPQLQGQTWIREREKENLTVIGIGSNKWLNQLVNAIPLGKAVMIEGIQEEIDATLDPLLQRAIKKQGSKYVLEIGGDPIDYDPNFKLYLVTKMYNPHFRPEIAAQCTIINFIVTESGLEEQLLAMVVNIEKNELEQQKQELVKKQNEFTETLAVLENNLLDSLNSADSRTILENKELIDNLDKTKKTTTEIQIQSAQAKQTEADINIQREFYRPVAAEGAMLYFLVIGLCIAEHMYQYSLESFIFFFLKAINRTTEKGEERIPRLILNIRYTIYQWISRGLFERHKLIFLTLITFRLMQKKQIEVLYEHAEMDFLIKCTPKPGVENTLEWLPTLAWDQVQGLIVLEEFKNFGQNLEKDAPNRFKDWYNTLTPEREKLPLDWKKLDTMPFKKLLVLRCMRPDRITVALQNFIRQVLPEGDTFIEMDSKLVFSEVLESSIADAEPDNPIFFILSPGSDPVKEVEKSARRRGIEPGKSLHIISLGQGQDENARRRIDEGNREGHWVFLQNIHLMPTWLLELEKILDAFGGDTSGGSANFRLFLSADPSNGVPIGILDRSIKLTSEPPTGLKANMKRSWMLVPKEEIEDKDPKIKSIFFALCFFHSTLIERRRFGPKGWNMNYPFSQGDLRDSYLVMTRYMEQNQGGKVPFDDLVYIFGEIMYGGHIVDDWDRKTCNNYLFNIMSDQLFDELELFPYIEGKGISFKVPGQNPYEKYIEYIETALQVETPLAYGLHPNAEIGFRTAQCISLFNTLIDLQPKDSGGEGAGEVKSANELTADLIKYLVEDMGIKALIFNIETIKQNIDPELRGPYQNVFLQEIEYMNSLLIEITKSLDDIDQGFKGILSISERMETIILQISLNRVPTPWQLLAYPSKRGLTSWISNLFQRIEQLQTFKEDPYNISKVVMISRFFNPQSFLTAIMQVIARQKSQELNKLYIQTEVLKRSIEEIDASAKEGCYVFGFILEGARWDVQGSYLDESRPKEMFSVLPVVYCKAQPIPGEGKEDKNLYICPTYKTEDRGGGTYVFPAQLKTRLPARKWILAGVAIILDVEGVSDAAGAVKEKKKE